MSWGLYNGGGGGGDEWGAPECQSSLVVCFRCFPLAGEAAQASLAAACKGSKQVNHKAVMLHNIYIYIYILSSYDIMPLYTILYTCILCTCICYTICYTVYKVNQERRKVQTGCAVEDEQPCMQHLKLQLGWGPGGEGVVQSRACCSERSIMQSQRA